MTVLDDPIDRVIKSLREPNWRPADVAAKLGINIHTIYRLIETGELRADKVGRSWSISMASLREAFPNTAW